MADSVARTLKSFARKLTGKESLNKNIPYRYLIKGKVQGVGYRKWTKKTALYLGLDGFCRNRSDGTVEVVVSSPDKNSIKTFEKLLYQGPKKASVTGVEKKRYKKEVPPGFKIKKTKEIDPAKEVKGQ